MSIQVKSLTKEFNKRTVLDQVNFLVKPGKITGLLGPNGAGKTTTMRLLTGYLTPTSGEILYENSKFEENSMEFKKKLGYLPESAALYPDMTISEYLDFIGSARHLSSDNLKKRKNEMKEVCELGSHFHSPIHSLSKGFKQRVSLAGTLIHEPEYIILDEPTSGLDPNQISHIRTLIKTISKQKTMILSTHILQEVEELCEDVIIINKGKVVANESVKNLHKNNGISLTAKTSLDDLKFQIKSEHIQSIEQIGSSTDGFNNFSLMIQNDQPEILFEKLKTVNFPVREFSVMKKSLESVFKELTVS